MDRGQVPVSLPMLTADTSEFLNSFEMCVCVHARMCARARVCMHPNISSCNPLGHLEHSLHYGRVHDSKGKKIPLMCWCLVTIKDI